jgi:hypothetical protein
LCKAAYHRQRWRPEHNEGSKAQENFERGMKALFQVQKDGTPRAKKPKKKRAKKTSEPGLFRDSGGEA